MIKQEPPSILNSSPWIKFHKKWRYNSTIQNQNQLVALLKKLVDSELGIGCDEQYNSRIN